MSELGSRLRTTLHEYRETFANGDVRAISRRYFIANGFDMTLTSIGITVGAFLSGVTTGATVVKVGLGAGIGLTTSAVWSVWEVERAEKQAELHHVENAMLTDLSRTELAVHNDRARKINAVMSGLGPIVGLLPITPYLLVGIVFSMVSATVASVSIGVGTLFVFGAYMGSISKQRWYTAGLRMGVAGIFVALLNLLLPG
ncbi:MULTISPECIES: VIT1/CCC1 transporter family protein [unclassified Haladaptatus]|uniref:VIT1/CCC1 transporter family protein n=1 Tax=unclassified Haladaptatus TaxID=2622732 RepID=UPI00209C0CC5|nr:MULTISPECIES: VIT1/CCC1 transporter family protein [unclassified Haladaptatus]MCO8244198.1 VIT1/CCC1 transporter family protein [Haladaptatus sp. AB643]MCO8256002.1 VIT1/CCC1 transporter family protein [Haladaptatus sp. AB618]